jgi:outer membrane receptor for ferrienterochelin and colicin
MRTEMTLHPGQELRFTVARQQLQHRSPSLNEQQWQLGQTFVEAVYFGTPITRHLTRLSLQGFVDDGELHDSQLQRRGATDHARFVLTDDWSIRANLRVRGVTSLDLNPAVGAMPGGRVALRYEPARSLVLRGAVGTSQRAATLTERVFVNSEVPFATPRSNLNLVAEKNQGVRLSVAIEPNRNNFLRLGFFWTDIQDRIEAMNSVDRWSSVVAPAYRNAGTASLLGLTARAQVVQDLAGWGLSGSYQWLPYAWDVQQQRRLAQRPLHCAQLRVFWNAPSLHTHAYSEVEAWLPELGVLDSLALVFSAGVRQLLFRRAEVGLSVDSAPGFEDSSLQLGQGRMHAVRLSLRMYSGL